MRHNRSRLIGSKTTTLNANSITPTQEQLQICYQIWLVAFWQIRIDLRSTFDNSYTNMMVEKHHNSHVDEFIWNCSGIFLCKYYADICLICAIQIHKTNWTYFIYFHYVWHLVCTPYSPFWRNVWFTSDGAYERLYICFTCIHFDCVHLLPFTYDFFLNHWNLEMPALQLSAFFEKKMSIVSNGLI